MQTVNAVIYGSTPRLLLGGIPFVGIIFTLWSLILGILGVRELQDLSTGKAILEKSEDKKLMLAIGSL